MSADLSRVLELQVGLRRAEGEILEEWREERGGALSSRLEGGEGIDLIIEVAMGAGPLGGGEDRWSRRGEVEIVFLSLIEGGEGMTQTEDQTSR